MFAKILIVGYLLLKIWHYPAGLSCPAGEWMCHDGNKCINGDYVCDGDPWDRDSCWDRSDEDPVICAQWNCTGGHWKCQYGNKCINENYVCDGDWLSNCLDGSDEDPTVCSEWNCPAGRWKCKDGLQCIYRLAPLHYIASIFLFMKMPCISQSEWHVAPPPQAKPCWLSHMVN